MTDTLRIARRLAAVSVVAGVLPLLTSPAQATPDRGSNCSGCHGAAATGMVMANFQGLADLGAGVLKFYRVTPGQSVAIQLNETNAYDGAYGLTINRLTNGGLTNNTHFLSFTADPTWTSRSSGTYFTVGPTTTSPVLWTFNLTVLAGTPYDTYSLQTQMAGKDIDATRWSQVESFYLQVVPAAGAPRPTIVAPQRVGNNFSAQVLTSSGFTYYLEYKTDLSAAAWSPAAQVAGDGTLKTLTDTGASDPQRFYRVRVQ